jgi:hypothetical protein
MVFEKQNEAPPSCCETGCAVTVAGNLFRADYFQLQTFKNLCFFLS